MNQDNPALPYYGYPNLRTTIIPVVVPGTTTGRKLELDGAKASFPPGAKLVSLSLVDYIAGATTLNNSDEVAEVADNTINYGGVVYLSNGKGYDHKLPLSHLIKRQASEPALRFPLPVDLDFINKKCYVTLTASNANLATNANRVIGFVVQYLDPTCPV
jgi:hypothetical protein